MQGTLAQQFRPTIRVCRSSLGCRAHFAVPTEMENVSLFAVPRADQVLQIELFLHGNSNYTKIVHQGLCVRYHINKCTQLLNVTDFLTCMYF